MRKKRRHAKKKEPKEISDAVKVALITGGTAIILRLIERLL